MTGVNFDPSWTSFSQSGWSTKQLVLRLKSLLEREHGFGLNLNLFKFKSAEEMQKLFSEYHESDDDDDDDNELVKRLAQKLKLGLKDMLIAEKSGLSKFNAYYHKHGDIDPRDFLFQCIATTLSGKNYVSEILSTCFEMKEYFPQMILLEKKMDEFMCDMREPHTQTYKFFKSSSRTRLLYNIALREDKILKIVSFEDTMRKRLFEYLQSFVTNYYDFPTTLVEKFIKMKSESESDAETLADFKRTIIEKSHHAYQVKWIEQLTTYSTISNRYNSKPILNAFGFETMADLLKNLYQTENKDTCFYDYMFGCVRKRRLQLASNQAISDDVVHRYARITELGLDARTMVEKIVTDIEEGCSDYDAKWLAGLKLYLHFDEYFYNPSSTDSMQCLLQTMGAETIEQIFSKSLEAQFKDMDFYVFLEACLVENVFSMMLTPEFETYKQTVRGWITNRQNHSSAKEHMIKIKDEVNDFCENHATMYAQIMKQKCMIERIFDSMDDPETMKRFCALLPVNDKNELYQVYEEDVCNDVLEFVCRRIMKRFEEAATKNGIFEESARILFFGCLIQSKCDFDFIENIQKQLKEHPDLIEYWVARCKQIIGFVSPSESLKTVHLRDDMNDPDQYIKRRRL